MAKKKQTATQRLRTSLSGESLEQQAARLAKERQMQIRARAEGFKKHNYSLEDVIGIFLDEIDGLKNMIAVNRGLDAVVSIIASSKDIDDDPVLKGFKNEFLEKQSQKGNLAAQSALKYNKSTQAMRAKKSATKINKNRKEHTEATYPKLQMLANKYWRANNRLSKGDVAKKIRNNSECPKTLVGEKYSIKQISKIIINSCK